MKSQIDVIYYQLSIVFLVKMTPDFTSGFHTRVVQKVLQMLGFHKYKSLILPKFVMLK